ncbi:MAG: sugar-binding protein [Bacteroidales bacterium]|nr:sugar-binding protein [Bacteroidales bacterium]
MVLILLCFCCLIGLSSCQAFEKIPFITKVSIIESANSGETCSIPFQKGDGFLAGIHVQGNNRTCTTTMNLHEATTLRVIAQGEGASYDITPSLIESYQNDCLEVFFDMRNDKTTRFDEGGDDYQYRIQWFFNSVDGKNIKLEGTDFKQSNPSENQYIIEIKFPWKTLGYLDPNPGQKIGFDLDVVDNDNNTREAQLSWNSTSDLLWRDPSVFGTLILKENLSDPETSVAQGMRVKTPPIIDGIPDPVWSTAPSYPFNHVILGKIDGEKDLSATFRALWSPENLYLLVEITDDIKKYSSFLFDEGRIEDEEGNTVWEMKMEKTTHAGGALKNRRQEDTLTLPAGIYKIHYQSDESHAFGAWDDTPPTALFSGIEIYRLNSQE